MLAYAGKWLGKLTEEVIQNAVCIVFVFPAWHPQNAQLIQELALAFFYMERVSGREKSDREGAFLTHFQEVTAHQSRLPSQHCAHLL